MKFFAIQFVALLFVITVFGHKFYKRQNLIETVLSSVDENGNSCPMNSLIYSSYYEFNNQVKKQVNNEINNEINEEVNEVNNEVNNEANNEVNEEVNNEVNEENNEGNNVNGELSEQKINEYLMETCKSKSCVEAYLAFFDAYMKETPEDGDIAGYINILNNCNTVGDSISVPTATTSNTINTTLNKKPTVSSIGGNASNETSGVNSLVINSGLFITILTFLYYLI